VVRGSLEERVEAAVSSIDDIVAALRF